MKEVPGDPAALKRAAKNKRKQKEAATEESGTNVRSMMTGVTEIIGKFLYTIYLSYLERSVHYNTSSLKNN